MTCPSFDDKAGKCRYINCHGLKKCLRVTPPTGAPFKRMSKLLPSPSKAKPVAQPKRAKAK